MLRSPDIYIPPLTEKTEQQRFTTRSDAVKTVAPAQPADLSRTSSSESSAGATPERSAELGALNLQGIEFARGWKLQGKEFSRTGPTIRIRVNLQEMYLLFSCFYNFTSSAFWDLLQFLLGLSLDIQCMSDVMWILKRLSLTAFSNTRHFWDDSCCHHQQRHQENHRKVLHLYKHKHTTP